MYKKLKAGDDKPKRTREVIFRFEETPDWAHMKADIEKGLKPNEALQVVFSEEDQKKYNIKSRRTISRFIQAYLAEQGLPYTVTSFERRETGDFFVLVKYLPAMKKRA